ncbi:glycosyltransferase [Paenibacillus allorhizosphaerae]|uniref:glycosyltransferase n=3 Tax=Paenibacillus allorhizosphaerae TaxID=2849866 RepID=UPI003619F9AB
MIKKISICMIVKDEEKNLRRCLDSLQSLLEQDYTELIIVDTGSTDSTVDIARDYTENVYLHQWNGNFSDMRNISISYATGEWIFIMDADEELETPSELISLLNNPKLKQYNTIRIREKNLLSLKLNKYVFHVQERLFRNDGAFKYKGTIHNQPVYKHPVLTEEIWLMHYGYINEDKDLMEKKFKRTASMLKKELEQDSEHVYYRFQLARSYMMHGDEVLALEEITKAYESMKKQSKELLIQRYYVFGEYARMSLSVKKYEQVIEICKEGLAYNQNYLDLYYYMGYAHLSLEQREEGIGHLEQYFHFYDKYNKNELDLSNFTAVEMYTLDEYAYQNTLDRVISTFYKDKSLVRNSDSYQRWLNKLQNKTMIQKLSAQLFFIINDYNKLLDLYHDVDEKDRFPFINFLESLKNDLEEEEKKVVELAFSNNEDAYGLLNRIRLNEARSKLLVEFINQYKITDFVDEVIIEFTKYLIESNLLIRFFKRLDSITIKKIVKVLIDKEDKNDYFLESLRIDYKFNDFQNNRVFVAVASVILLSIIENEGNKININNELMDIFNDYINKGIEYIQYVYNIERIRLIYSTLTNKEEQFFAILYMANSSLQNGDVRNYQKYILEATNVYPYLSKMLKVYVSNILELNIIGKT